MHALLFTDVENSTRLHEALGDERAATVWTAHDRRSRDLLARHRGREIGRADGLFLLFDSTADAASYALDYRAALAELGLTTRVGIHAGAVTLRANAASDIARGANDLEVDGIATPIAARIMALARGGQILDERGSARGARCRPACGRGCRGSRALPAQGHRITPRNPRARCPRRLPVRPSRGRRQGVSRGARRRPVASRARSATQPAAGTRCIRGSRNGVARARATSFTWRTLAHDSRPGRDGQDTPRAPIRLGMARRLARRCLLLRSLRRSLARGNRLCHRIGARRSARTPGTGRAVESRDCGAWPLPRRARQLRAGRGARAGYAFALARRGARCRIRRHEPRAPAAARRAGPRDRAARARRRRDRSIRRESARTAPGVFPRRNQSRSRCRSRSPARRPATCHRTGRGARQRVLARRTSGTNARALQVARPDARRTATAGDAARGHRLVVGAPHCMGTSRPRAVLDVRRGLHARSR